MLLNFLFPFVSTLTPNFLSPNQQATDEDSPPNNLLTYTITSASAFSSYFSIVMVEGYAGTAAALD